MPLPLTLSDLLFQTFRSQYPIESIVYWLECAYWQIANYVGFITFLFKGRGNCLCQTTGNTRKQYKLGTWLPWLSFEVILAVSFHGDIALVSSLCHMLDFTTLQGSYGNLTVVFQTFAGQNYFFPDFPRHFFMFVNKNIFKNWLFNAEISYTASNGNLTYYVRYYVQKPIIAIVLQNDDISIIWFWWQR